MELVLGFASEKWPQSEKISDSASEYQVGLRFVTHVVRYKSFAKQYTSLGSFVIVL